MSSCSLVVEVEAAASECITQCVCSHDCSYFICANTHVDICHRKFRNMQMRAHVSVCAFTNACAHVVVHAYVHGCVRARAHMCACAHRAPSDSGTRSHAPSDNCMSQLRPERGQQGRLGFVYANKKLCEQIEHRVAGRCPYSSLHVREACCSTFLAEFVQKHVRVNFP